MRLTTTTGTACELERISCHSSGYKLMHQLGVVIIKRIGKDLESAILINGKESGKEELEEVVKGCLVRECHLLYLAKEGFNGQRSRSRLGIPEQTSARTVPEDSPTRFFGHMPGVPSLRSQ
jgi:hypothetical protein